MVFKETVLDFGLMLAQSSKAQPLHYEVSLVFPII